MKAKTAMLVGLVLSIAAMAEATPIDSNAIVQDGIEYYMQTDKSVYNLGEEVEMLYRVTNLGDEDVEFIFPCGPVTDRCDYIVEKDGERIWDNLVRWVTWAFTQFTLSPLESYEYTHTWDMMNNNGTPWLPDDDFLISPGLYNVIGALGDLASGYEDRYVPVSVSIEVIPEPATTYYVDANAEGLNDGSNWEDAFNYLQDALDNAQSGDEIRVAEGIYKPDDDTANHPDGTGNRYATFQLINSVAIYGGFPPGGGNWEDRDPNDPNNETTLSGDIGTEGVNGDNSYHVVTGADNATLDGFTITDGYADGYWPDGYMDGAGIYCYESSPTIRNCIIRDNSTGDLGYGAGMFNDASNPTLVNCTFSENSAGNYGGGMLNHVSNTTLIDCTFSWNSTDGAAGGMFNWSSSPTLTNCIFNSNSTSFDAGGGMLNYDSSVTLTNCLFSDNSTSHHGGGIYIYDGVTTLINCTFGGNFASHKSGGLYNYAGDLIATSCIFWGNSDEGGTDESAQIDGNTPDVSYSCIQDDNQDDGYIYPGTGNIDVDPCFADPCNGDYHLLRGSPCIDAGDNTAVPLDTTDLDGDGNTAELIPFDLDGNPRIVDGNDDGNSVVDMGAYETALSDPVELLDILAQDIIDLGLHHGIENSLLVKLDTALQKLEDDNQNNDVAAINSLQAFINAVEAQRGKKIPQADADDLIAAALQIIELLSNG